MQLDEKKGYSDFADLDTGSVTIGGLHENDNRKKESLEDELVEKWSTKKQKSETLSVIYDDLRILTKNRIYENKPMKVRNCGSYLEFNVNPSDRTDKKLRRAFFCKDRLCPMCNWRRSLKIFGQVSKIFDYIEATYPDKYDYLFLTLTIKNVNFGDLDKGLKVIQNGLRFLTNKSEPFKKISQGTFSTIEITYNSKSDQWHPHVHLIVLVEKKYFKSRDYLSAEAWSDLWKKCCDLDYGPIVNVQKVKKISNGIAEVSKYMVKDSDYLDEDKLEMTIKKVHVLAQSIRAKRLTSKTGLIKDIHKILNLDDSENGDLVNTDNEKLNPAVAYVLEKYSWKCGIYTAC